MSLRALACVLLLLSFTMSARADAVSKEGKVREMLTLMHMKETTNRLEEAQEVRIRALSEQQLAGVTLDDDQKKNYEDFQSKVTSLLKTSASWKALEPDFVKLYSDAYSEQEIDGILQFYRSPVGQVMLSKTAQLTEESISLSQSV